jgi:putative transposase
LSYRERLGLVNKEHPNISVSRQAGLLDISRSSLYYQPIISSEDIAIINAIDEVFTKYPFYGHRRVRKDLDTDYGIQIGKKRTISLMKEMGLEAIYPKKKWHLSDPDQSHRKFPYLLSGLPILQPNQVWGTDITYIRLLRGFAYLVAIIDWYSRYVISWQLSETLDIGFCLENLERALEINIPDIHNSDQGSHFTSNRYINILNAKPTIRISMDGRGRCLDNIFTERFWRSLKYENVYLNEYRNFCEANQGIADYIKFFNEQRKHQSLDYKTPAQIYFAK